MCAKSFPFFINENERERERDERRSENQCENDFLLCARWPRRGEEERDVCLMDRGQLQF